MILTKQIIKNIDYILRCSLLGTYKTRFSILVIFFRHSISLHV